MSGDVHQSDNGCNGSRFRNNGSPIAVRDKDGRSVLQCEDTPYRGHIIGEGRLRLLDDADVEAIPDEDIQRMCLGPHANLDISQLIRERLWVPVTVSRDG